MEITGSNRTLGLLAGLAVALGIVFAFLLFGPLKEPVKEPDPDEKAELSELAAALEENKRLNPAMAEVKELDLEPPLDIPNWRAGDPETPDVSVFEAQLDCLNQAMDTAYQPAPIVDPVPTIGPDLLRVRARFSYFEGRLDLSHPRNYSDHSRLARIVGAAERHGHDVAACLHEQEQDE